MDKKVLVLDAEKESCQVLCKILEEQNYSTTALSSISDLEGQLENGGYLVVILDIDSISVDNRVIRKITQGYPGIYFLCTSRDRFHPELEDAICNNIYACLAKPIDTDELFYLLKSIYEQDVDAK